MRRRSLVPAFLIAACSAHVTPREVSEAALTTGAEAFTVWLDVEIAKAQARPGGPARDARVAVLAHVNERWNALEDVFNAAWAAYDVAKQAGHDDAAALRKAVEARDHALAFLREIGAMK